MDLSEQYDEYLQIIRDKEELFKNEILQYSISEVLVHLCQLKHAIELGEYTRENIVRENKQIEIALRSNILDWKIGLTSAEETMKIVETWTSGISANIERMEKVESNIKLITRVMDVLHARVYETVNSPTKDIITNNDIVAANQINKESLIETNDKYFFVTLLSSKEDGPDEYVSDILTKNFKSIFPDSFPVAAYCYSIGRGPENSLCLNGLIRFDHRGRYRISPKSSHIKNIITSSITGIKTPRHFTVQTLTQYINKRYQTRIIDFQARYTFIENHGRVIGNSKEEMVK